MDVESRQQGLETHLSSNLLRRQQELQEVLLGADAEAERWVMPGALEPQGRACISCMGGGEASAVLWCWRLPGKLECCC